MVTRFPPEPNGYLHIGHAKSICLNFGIAQEFGGRCHLRFDDTNPAKEEQEYIDSIMRDVRWLGFDWGEHLHHASDYFAQLYDWAEHLIRAGKAYVDDLPADEMRAMRGTLTEPGRNSPYRDRAVDENLDLFRRMRAGEYPDGARVLRAKIDMASGNMNMRDPVLYRILHAEHPRTGKTWCIYPTYDFAHGQSDAIEHITHSLCTLEFEDHRPLYDWFLDNLPVPSRPRQYEFARLNITYTVLSKRVLTELVRGGHVGGWDDPRMPTLAGLRRRGVPAAAIRDFIRRVGVARANSVVEAAMFDHAVRELLNKSAPRRMAVLRPLKLVIENWPEGQIEELDAINNPEDPEAGKRKVKFGREIYVERDDFMENPPKKFYRLSPGREVRLRYAYFVTCREVVKNAAGEVTELRCTYDPATKRRRFAGRAQGAGDLALGRGGGRHEGRAAALQSALHQPGAGCLRRSRRRAQPQLSRNSRRLPGGAGACRHQQRGRRPVRAPGLFLPRRRFEARPSRVQSHRRAARHMGQGPGQGRLGATHRHIRLAPPRPAEEDQPAREHETRRGILRSAKSDRRSRLRRKRAFNPGKAPFPAFQGTPGLAMLDAIIAIPRSWRPPRAVKSPHREDHMMAVLARSASAACIALLALSGSAEAQKAKDTLRVAFDQQIRLIDAIHNPNPEANVVDRAVMSTLVAFDPATKTFRGQLAKSWSGSTTKRSSSSCARASSSTTARSSTPTMSSIRSRTRSIRT